MVSRKGGRLAHPKRYPGWNARMVRRGQQSGRGRARFLAKNVPIRTRLGRLKSPKKQTTNSEKGERWNGRGGAERRGSEPTQTDSRFETLMPGKIINFNSEDGSGGMGWWVGRDGGTSPPKPMPGSS